MIAETPTPAPAAPDPSPGWRRPSIAVAVAAVGAQVLGFWLVSPGDHTRSPGRPPVTARQAFVDGEAGGAAVQSWLWLLNPAVFVQPSERDFSGVAWLEGTPLRVEIEAFAVPQRPLPFESAVAPGAALRLPVDARGPLARLDPGPGSRWDLSEGRTAPPPTGPVPLPVESQLRVLSGLAGWQLANRPAWPASAEAAGALPVVVRLALGADGEPATPPTVWESSGVPALDEAAVTLARGLRWRNPAAPPREDAWADTGAGWTWGLVEFRFGLGPPAP